jgi:GTPase
MPQKVALIGRPNVGKSTLFNNLIGKHLAITAEESGTTRDRIEQEITLNRVSFTLIDAGGVETESGSNLDADVQYQVKYAIENADILIFLVDAKSEITTEDSAVAESLRKTNKPIIFVANKFESGDVSQLMNFASFGIGVPIGISAVHKIALDELTNLITKELRSLRRKQKIPKVKTKQEKIEANIAIVGRPNVGKSSLVNKIFGADRVVVSDIPLTTRDVNDVVVEVAEKKYRLLDTAGMRRSGKVGRGIDRFATGRTLGALRHADVALLLLDGDEKLVAQDLHIAEKILAADCGILIGVNKTDTWEDYEELQENWMKHLERKFQFARYAPVIFLSAKNGKNLQHLFPRILEIQAERKKRIKTPELNCFIKKIVAQHSPSQTDKAKSPPKIFYATQADEVIPTFVFFVNRPRAFHFSYRRFIENRLREKYGFGGTPIRLEFRERKR